MSGTRPGIPALRELLPRWDLPGEAAIERLDTGHVNETFRVRAGDAMLLVQWLNPEVFPEAGQVQDNIRVLLDHLETRAPGRYPRLVRGRDGEDHLRTPGGLWRAMSWLPGRRTIDRPEGRASAAEGGRALARFLRDTDDLPEDRLHDVLPGFHDLASRLAALDRVREARPERAAEAGAELERVDADRDRHLGELGAGPERVIHGDTKFTNILLPPESGDAAAVMIDYDTVMRGRPAWDVGDFLRSAAATGAEDDPYRAGVEADVLLAAADGLADVLGGSIGEAPEAVAAAPGHMSFMLGVRFLTDHLAGDRYFRVHRPGQNLDRARTQFAQARAFDARAGALADHLRRRR